MSSLDIEDLEAIEDQVKRYISQDIQPIVAQHEIIASPSQVKSVLQVALDMGVLPTSSFNKEDNFGLSIWEEPDDHLSRLLSTQLLSLIAETNVGVAYQFHLYSMTQWLRKELKIKSEDTEKPDSKKLDSMTLSLQGHYGLARYSLAHYLKGQTSTDDIEILKEYFCASKELSCYLHSSDWQTLLAPIMDNNGVIQWQLLSIDNINRAEYKNNHGFDELSCWLWSRKKENQTVVSQTEISQSDLTEKDSRAILKQLYAINAIGLMSISQGSIKRALSMAKDYCSIRVQGGKKIALHPAVQTLLSQVSHFDHMANIHIQSGLTQSTFDNLGLLSLMRANLHVEACQAANNALQTFGGIGYMQDNGIEKIVRDNNQLRLLSGTPTELKLFATAWENEL